MSRAGSVGSAPAPAASSASAAPRYKAITRELLTSVCRKHFTLRSVGASVSGTSRAFKGTQLKDKLEYAGQHGEGYDYSSTEVQSKLETLERYLKRATHLQLDNLKLTHTFPPPEAAQPDNSFALARSIRVLYLHENSLSTMDSLSFCADTLSHLYLQNNNITRMQNLLPLRALEKLYIGGNQIQLLEGFADEAAERELQEQMEAQQQQGADGGDEPQSQPRRAQPPAPFYLVELHMDAQRLPVDQCLQLSIPSIQALSHSLTTLSLCHNGMDSDSILPISLLHRLQSLALAHNRIEDLKMVAEMCSYLHELTELDLRENPLNSGAGDTAVTHKKYRDRIIMSSRSIRKLDDKDVPDNQREYLHSLAEQRRLKREKAAMASGTPRVPSEEEKKFAALHAPPAFPYAPKVLTLRTSNPGAGAVSIGAVGGMGAGSQHTMHAGGGGGGAGSGGNSAPYHAQHQQYAASSSSPFIDDDEYLGQGGGSSGGQGGASGDDSFDPRADPRGAQVAPEGTASSMTFTGDPARLNDLLQQRGLVSAFQGGMALGGASASAGDSVDAAESARVRRASMNSLNQAPIGWDGGRTPHAAPMGALPAAAAHATHERKSSAGSRTGSRGATKPAAK